MLKQQLLIVGCGDTALPGLFRCQAIWMARQVSAELTGAPVICWRRWAKTRCYHNVAIGMFSGDA
jgi:hypothetical protein